MSDPKGAHPDHPIHELLAQRWSPYAFDERSVAAADLASLFEAARWAASSYNEQPWRYLVATKDNPKGFDRILSCLVEANQAWAKSAPVLALAAVSLRFDRNGKPNRAAHHDLGLASANLVIEATSRGLYVHQMIGILPERAQQLFAVPEGFEVLTGMAIGYRSTAPSAAEELRQRDETPRSRRALGQSVFSDEWGRSFV